MNPYNTYIYLRYQVPIAVQIGVPKYNQSATDDIENILKEI